ncbi:MAG: hypothetical protein OEY14_02600, partial [Myxococcales bacterium]|nr:hypothetical protein [Myxococcales bacterium]
KLMALWMASGALCLVLSLEVRAQIFELPSLGAEPGAEGNAEELAAWEQVQARNLIKARELGERVVAADPSSFVGHYVLAHVHHYAEANFPRALFYANRAEALFRMRHGDPPSPGSPWRWHSRILLELGAVHGDLEHYEERLAYMSRYDALYDPDQIAERAWPLMKLGRFAEARLAAAAGMATNDRWQQEVALNALCAIEFEAGNALQSYEACAQALQSARRRSRANAVDLTNFAEASRSLFKLDEAESVLLEATEAPLAWYGNPWLELADVFTREGRFPEAHSALEHIPPYRARRPPHVREADRTEARRGVSAFLLVIGEADAAIEITEKALVMPDRRSHNSRDPAQDRVVVALLDRRARMMRAAEIEEAASARPWYERVLAFGEASVSRFEAWLSGRQAVTLLTEEDRLVGTFRIGLAESAIMPPWLVGELVELLGGGVVAEAIERARAGDARSEAASYYDAFEAEAALSGGDPERAIELGERALLGLGQAEVLLRARTHALLAEAARQLGEPELLAHYDQAFQRDPGVLRRLDLALPVQVEIRGDAIAEAVQDALLRSPRFEEGEGGLRIEGQADAGGGRICLQSRLGVLACAGASPEPSDTPDALAARIVEALLSEAFAPRIDLSQGDINGLDGSHQVDRDPLRSLFGDPDEP